MSDSVRLLMTTRRGVVSVFLGLCLCQGAMVLRADDAGAESVSRVADESTREHELAVDDFNLPVWLDARYVDQWSAEGVSPALCDDATYLRRVSLDLVGRIPSVAMTRDFLSDDDPGKRHSIVDRLMADPEVSGKNNVLHAEHLAAVWRRMLIPPTRGNSAMARTIDPWFVRQFEENTPYDVIVQRLLTAEGGESMMPARVYRAVGGNAESYADSFSRVFLGVRIGCAQCHDHPFADWKQDDFWGMVAFFSATSFGQSEGAGQPTPNGGGLAEALGPVRANYEGQAFAPKVLWSDEVIDIAAEQRPREVLAAWLTSPENPHFAATAVNRVWQMLLGEGNVSEVDDLDLVSAEERQRILDPLAQQFIASGYDLRWLIAGICKSRAYQLESRGSVDVAATVMSGRRALKTLTPQQVFDSLEQALLLPVTRSDERSARHNGQMLQLVRRLDESISTSPTEYSAGVPQVLLLMNGAVIAEATRIERSQTLRAVVGAPFLEPDEKLEALYMATLTRRPSVAEQSRLLEHVSGQPDEAAQQRAYGEILWALVNSPEFVLCR